MKRREGEILAAAVEIFHARGYTATTVQDIATAVGILKGSLYHYIDAKEDLLFQIATDVHDAVREMLENAAGRTDLSPLDRVALYAGQQIEYNARNVERIAIYHNDYRRLSAGRLAEIERRREAHVAFMQGLLREAQERGDLDAATDVRIAGATIFSLIVYVYTWYQPGSLSPEELQRFCVDFLLHGLGARSV